MRRRIQILPDHIANQIAAGEVIERPASAVKELVENSLDAAATRIEVEVRNGGKTGIRVVDDGSGMDRRDALLAIDRHATSKIESESDLRSVLTFGFRGEALPSIAAVSRFELETASSDEGTGTRVRVHGGKVVDVQEVARQRGTTVSVRSLFYNVPARAKFLRSAAAETRAISESVTALALANLSTSFRVVSNGRELLELPRASELVDRVSGIWGDQLAGTLLPLDRTIGRIRVAGLVQRPAATRPGTRRVHLFVNGRPFVDRFVARAAEEAYRTTVPARHRPALFLYIDLPPDEVDVNVHPTKAEVRFRDKIGVEKAVTEAVRSALENLDSTPSAVAAARGGGQLVGGRPIRRAGPQPVTPEKQGRPQLAFFVPGGDESVEGSETEADPEPVPRRAMWQMHHAYILAETRSGLVIIDQHSAHERVLFERIMAGFDGDGTTSQRLLFPLTVRLAPAEFQAVEELSGILNRTGFELEPFGENTVIVHSVPNPHPHFDAERCFREMIEELTHGSPLVDSARTQHEKVAKSFACKAAIKAGQPLSEAEMSELVDRLFATDLPGHDVHGRPTILRLTLEELARRFGRN